MTPNTFTRRELLLSAAAVTAAAAPRSKMRFGFTTYQWGADWDIPTIIANCTKAKALAVELRTSARYAHGIELDTGAPRRAEVKKIFAGSPVALISIASAERFDWLDAEKVKAAVEAAKAHARLSHDVGSKAVRVFPNDFHKEVPEERTIAQIARALNEVGTYAADFGQLIEVENHGTAGRLATLKAILDQVAAKNVRVKLNCDSRDAADFADRFAPVKNRLGITLHTHELPDSKFPYELQAKLLMQAGWDGWWLLEATAKVPDRARALVEQREKWEELVSRS